MGPERLGAADDRPQVLGIGEAIHRHQQRRFADAGASLKQGRQVQGFRSGGLQGNALVHGPTSDLPQARPGDLLHQHPGGFGLAQQLEKFRAEPHLRRAPDAVNGTTTFKGRLGWMASPDQVGAGVNAVALRIATGGEAVGIDNQGLGREASWRRAPTFEPATFRSGAVESPTVSTASFEAGAIGTAPCKTATIGASCCIGAPTLGTTFKTATRPAVVGLAIGGTAIP